MRYLRKKTQVQLLEVAAAELSSLKSERHVYERRQGILFRTPKEKVQARIARDLASLKSHDINGKDPTC